MSVDLEKIKAAAPIEVTAAFYGAKEIVDRVGRQNLPEGVTSNDVANNFGIMFSCLSILVILNILLLIRQSKNVYTIVFSSILFIVWAINIDIFRWQDHINGLLHLEPGGFDAVPLLGLMAILLSTLMAIFGLPKRAE